MRRIYSATDAVVGYVDASGIVTGGGPPGPPLGLVRNNEVFTDAAGTERLGFVDTNRCVFDERFDLAATVDAGGKVTDKSGRILGRVEEPRDAAALIFILGEHVALEVEPPPASESSLMEEVLDQAYRQDQTATSPQRPPREPF